MKRKNIALTLLCCAGLLGLCGCGGEETTETADVLTATVYADAQVGGEFIYPYAEVTASADAAENVGLADEIAPETAVSALDVLVAVHEELYGEAFTADPAAYLGVDGGWISNAFENSTDSWSVIYNGESAHSDVESSYGGYEALMINQTAVADGDVVEFVAYQDTVNYADNALWIMQDGTRITSLEVAVGEEVSLNVQGYTYSFFSSYGTETIAAEYLAPVAGVQLGTMAEDGTITAIDGAVCDADGNVTYVPAEAGTYTVVAYLSAGDVVAFFSALTVTVK